MKFWKLKMNDRNYLLVSVRREHMRDVTLCSEQMQQEHQSFAGEYCKGGYPLSDCGGCKSCKFVQSGGGMLSGVLVYEAV